MLRVLVTHCHPDHVGLAHWLCKHWDVRLWMSLGDYMTARVMSGGSGVGSNAGGDFAASHFARHGLTDPDYLEKLRARKAYYPSMVPEVPTQYRRLMDEDTVDIGADPATAGWRVITGFGHAPEHVALYNAANNVLISGDMVLPRISTNVSVFDMEPEANPLQLYLDSLDKYEDLPADVLILPSHGRPFRNLHTRIRQLQEHHVDRLAETLAACAEKPCHAHDIVGVIFRRQFDIHQLTFAMGEALAHLHALWHRGQLVRECGDDGIVRFRAA
ncbi:Hydroxyacylglutathione hydrolase [compost metagenome]